jgi:hypothetical protein
MVSNYQNLLNRNFIDIQKIRVENMLSFSLNAFTGHITALGGQLTFQSFFSATLNTSKASAGFSKSWTSFDTFSTSVGIVTIQMTLQMLISTALKACNTTTKSALCSAIYFAVY